MKKKIRILSLLVAGLLCLSLTGCKELDNLRENQAFWQGEDTFLWKDTLYKRLPETDLELNGEADKKDGAEIWVNVTEADVPVLLSSMGTSLSSYQNGLFLGDYTMIFCVAERYEEMVEQMEQEGTNLTGMMYRYSDVDEDGRWIYRDYTLTEEQVQAVKDVYVTALPTLMEDGMYLQSDDSLSLYGVTANGCFKQSLFDLEVAGNTYYIVEYDGGGNTYRVPDDYAPIFAEIFAPMLEAKERLYGDDWWGDEYGDEWDA